MSQTEANGYELLRHGGMLLDPQRLRNLTESTPPPMPAGLAYELRQKTGRLLDSNQADTTTEFAAFVLERVCGFQPDHGTWTRGNQVSADWARTAFTGEQIKPRWLWQGHQGGLLPVFFSQEKRIGIGRGKRDTSRVLQWLRGGRQHLALLTNGRQWRLIFAALDYDAWCEWDTDLWLEEGQISPQVDILRLLIQPSLWIPPTPDAQPPLAAAVLDSRKGQADLSNVLGEQVRKAVEILIFAHGDTLKTQCPNADPSEIYRAAVRVIMRLVVILFAESRDLLPRENPLYHQAYGLTGLLESLSKHSARGRAALERAWTAWPRVLGLFRLVYEGSHHTELLVPRYEGELFAAGDQNSSDPLAHALAVFETACFNQELMSDEQVKQILELISRTKVRIKQGRQSIAIPAPVDFSDLSSEYIGILYEGLLDFELKTAPDGDPVVFLALGNEPALPLSRLEAMDDSAIANLLKSLKAKNQKQDAEDEDEDEPADEEPDEELDEAEESEEDDSPADEEEDTTEDSQDQRNQVRSRAAEWARRAVVAGKLVKKPRKTSKGQTANEFDQAVANTAKGLVRRVVLPGEWYLVRWGGTRKGSGSFYTRPGLAVPTVQRTLQPLCYHSAPGTPTAPPAQPRPPEEILGLKVCDPACGSGTFPVAALRYLTDALFTSLHHHNRIRQDGPHAIVQLLTPTPEQAEHAEPLTAELLPCRPDDEQFEPRLKALLRRHIVERCIYGVDLDPLAVELCRLALWIETLDRSLPFSFLDHKIKNGNALIGAWFDQFQHYPVMAWKNRDGGDDKYTNGVYFEKGARTQAIKTFVKDRLTPDLSHVLEGQTLFQKDHLESAAAIHDEALAKLEQLHKMPVHESTERARFYREELLGAPAYQRLKTAMDLWCACWFWPGDAVDHAPLPSTLADPDPATRQIAEQIAATKRFFHWELEFPDVFHATSSGFDAVLGNPPWETLQPNSKEFFSNIDPLYRAYGKQEALRKQSEYFADAQIEDSWLDYNHNFSCFTNWMKHASNPFGDPELAESNPEQFSISKGKANPKKHHLWRTSRKKSKGFISVPHPFAFRGSGKAYTYKLFLETSHAIAREGGRIGIIVPSGLYSDQGSIALRRLFLDQCQWEWLFGFENRNKIFDIDSRYKFNPIVVTKGGKTSAIKAAFMRRELDDWEHAEEFVTPYSREQVQRFSPNSLAILEIQSARDLEILEKIYSNSVLLGDDSPDGWGIKYAQGDFNMTSDSHLFPPRPKWEAKGYRPDEYSRWLKGDWRPIAELWQQLRIDPNHVVPIAPECQAEIEAYGADVEHTQWQRRCAQPPYDTLPIPRADIPEGIILARNADEWIHEEKVEDVALPLVEGSMIHQFDSSRKIWKRNAGNTGKWEPNNWNFKTINPRYILSTKDFRPSSPNALKVGFRDIARNTDTRTALASIIPALPCGNTSPVLFDLSINQALLLPVFLNSYVIDSAIRKRIAGTHLNYHFIAETPLHTPNSDLCDRLACLCLELACATTSFSAFWLIAKRTNNNSGWKSLWKLTKPFHLEGRVIADALTMEAYGLNKADSKYILKDCDNPSSEKPDHFSSVGFWRVDKDKDPELRHTVLTLVAFHDLEQKIRECGGDRDKGIEAFLTQNNGEGWMLPETLRLADYGLGHDERALQPQPVASRLGPRFYDWQLAQTAEESWRECHLHARNQLGAAGYRKLLAEIEHGEQPAPEPSTPATPSKQPKTGLYQPELLSDDT